MSRFGEKLLGRSRPGVGDEPIGCVYDASNVRLIQTQEFGSPSVLSALEPCGPQRGGPRRAVQAAIRRAYASAPFHGRDAVACLGNEFVSYRRMLIPLLPDSQARAMVCEHAARELGRDPRDLRSDYYSIGEVNEGGRRKRELIVVSAALSDLQAMSNTLREGGLRPIALDSECGALARCLSTVENPEPCFIIDLRGAAPVILVAASAAPKLIYTTGSGLHMLTRPRSDPGPAGPGVASDPSGMIELAREVSMCAHYLDERQDTPLIVKYGYVVGARQEEGAVVRELTSAGIVEFRRLIEHHDEKVRCRIEMIAALGNPNDWVIPLGLSMYTPESAKVSP